MKIKHVYFVWNAQLNLSGAATAVSDFLRGKHSCSLCDVAYRQVMQKSDWKEYKRSLHIPASEVFVNQLSAEQREAADGEYPVVLGALEDGRLFKLLSKAEIDACAGELEPFKTKLDAALMAE